MATKVERERGQSGTGDTVKHIYPPSGGTLGIGSVAYCGHVKTTPWSGRYVRPRDLGRDHCVVCADLAWRPS